ncbi:carbohydrate-binding family 9-like protein [Litorilituus lipolyticus]|uniref:Carbohydrate-binding domain-containing protein n=1 Tax=Litorilituus lipolyticus TaxID=2491017 RepID=A0A502KS56_9GAMM|nr:carbohydrate-binding family 9-like protein [Litorilituus lipolyticus]TPH12871.1 hypothetical protein EPA86_15775 [Litorilituus lipolyticus]
MKQYTIPSLANGSFGCATSSQVSWQDIPQLHIATYPWFKQGIKQDTSVKLAASSTHLHIQIIAQDNHSYAVQTQLNHMLICEDSCVEFFFSPSGELGSDYINLEVNCCGTLHIAYGPNREQRQFISLESASKISCVSSITSPVKFEQEQDSHWQIELTIPFDVIKEITKKEINLNHWYGNFYRCGGRVEPQYSVWNNIDVNQPDYHRPEFFGKLSFDV